MVGADDGMSGRCRLAAVKATATAMVTAMAAAMAVATAMATATAMAMAMAMATTKWMVFYWSQNWLATRVSTVARWHTMTKAGSGQQCNNQPVKGAAKAGSG